MRLLKQFLKNLAILMKSKVWHVLVHVLLCFLTSCVFLQTSFFSWAFGVVLFEIATMGKFLLDHL